MEEELTLLALTFLQSRLGRGGPAEQHLSSLQELAAETGLLPARTDYAGQSHACSAPELRQQYPNLDAATLSDLLQHLLQRRRDDGDPGAQFLQTLLGPGRLSVLNAKGPAAVASVPQRRSQQQSLARGLELRQVRGRAGDAAKRLAPQLAMRSLRFVRTSRGHHMVVYTVCFSADGALLATGSDDWLVKIWGAESGRLMHTCRGHGAEVTEVAASCDGELLASASTDKTVRVWSLRKETLGAPVAVLVGHTGSVNSLDFHPLMPYVLASASDDGTCRVWDARDGSVPSHLLNGQEEAQASRLSNTATATPSAGTAPAAAARRSVEPATHLPGAAAMFDSLQQGGASQQQAHNAAYNGSVDRGDLPMTGGADNNGQADAPTDALVQNSVRFVDNGRTIVSAGGGGTLYMWQWRADAFTSSPSVRSPGQKGPVLWEQDWEALGAPEWAGALEAHQMDVVILKPSRSGSLLASISGEGVWIWQNKGAPTGTAKRVSDPGSSGALGTSTASARPVGGWTRVRLIELPPEPIDMTRVAQKRKAAAAQAYYFTRVSWSADDSRLVAGANNGSVTVWDVATGRLLHKLDGHDSHEVDVVDCHPSLDSLVVTAGCDGCAVVWDIAQGKLICKFNSQDTIPLTGAQWTEGLELVEGRWTPDGMGIVLGDTAGQVHFYRVGTPAPESQRWPYDQFWSRDYATLTRSNNMWAVDAEHQLAPHLLTSDQLLVDRSEHPYPPEVQKAASTGCSEELPAVSKRELSPGLSSMPPTATSAIWLAMQYGQSMAACQAASERAMARHRTALQAHLEYRVTGQLPTDVGLPSAADDPILWSYLQDTARPTTTNANNPTSGAARRTNRRRSPSIDSLSSSSQPSGDDDSGSDAHFSDSGGDSDGYTSLSEESDEDLNDSDFGGDSDRRRRRRRGGGVNGGSGGGGRRRSRARRGKRSKRSKRRGVRDVETIAPTRRTTRTNAGRNKRYHSDDESEDDRPDGDYEMPVRMTRNRASAAAAAAPAQDEAVAEPTPRPRRGAREVAAPAADAAPAEENGEPVIAPPPPPFDSPAGPAHIARGGRASRASRKIADSDDDVPSHSSSPRRDGSDADMPAKSRKRQRGASGPSTRAAAADSDQSWQASDSDKNESSEADSDFGGLANGDDDSSSGGFGERRKRKKRRRDARGSRAARSGRSSRRKAAAAAEPVRRSSRTHAARVDSDYASEGELGSELGSDSEDVGRRRSGRRGAQREPEPEPVRRSTRAGGRRLATLASAFASDEDDAALGADMDHGEPHSQHPQTDSVAGPSKAAGHAALDNGDGPARQARRARHVRSASAEPEVPEQPAMAPAEAPAQGVGGGAKSRRRAEHRPAKAYAWLRNTQRSLHSYAPQLGDEVMYLQDGHDAYLRLIQDTHTPRPWLQLAIAAASLSPPVTWSMRPAEPCQVVAIEYVMVPTGASQVQTTVPRLKLQLVDCPSELPHRSFEVLLPSPSQGAAEFVILSSQYQGAVLRHWPIGSRCKIYVADGDGEGGGWWDAVVVSDKASSSQHALLNDHDSSPQGLSGQTQWERYGIQWVGEKPLPGQGDGDDDVVEVSAWLSPWELAPPDVDAWERECLAAEPALSDAAKRRALRAVRSVLPGGARYQEGYNLFEHAPKPDASYKCGHPDMRGRTVAYNVRVPLPFGLRDIEGRTETGFYRQISALREDLKLIGRNASWFNGPNSYIHDTALQLYTVIEEQLRGLD